jgi:pSer/pThr/pTyr-binding forkhead associated (FHA) protein
MADEETGTFLKVVKGGEEGTECALAAGRVYLIGRSSKADISVSDQTVSHKHAKVENVNGIWFVMDAGSRHGTYVNKRPIEGRKALFDRDVIRVGKTLVEFREYEPMSQQDLDEAEVGLKKPADEGET